MKQNLGSEDYDDPRPNPGFLAKFRAAFVNREEYDEDNEETAETVSHSTDQTRNSNGINTVARRPSPNLRLDQARRMHVIVRRAVQSFDDARRAADGLKAGQQQIVNLEQTPPQMSERIVDFLNGATYALDGCVEKIGEQVYLFTPSSVTIDIEERPSPGTRTSFLDRT